MQSFRAMKGSIINSEKTSAMDNNTIVKIYASLTYSTYITVSRSS